MKKVRFVLPEDVFASVTLLESRAGVVTVPAVPAPAAEAQELLTAKEVEELLRIDIKTIYKYVQKGLIPYVKIQSNLRFAKSAVLAWVAEHQSDGKSPKRK
jgi:excisionase family DNA binding protein